MSAARADIAYHLNWSNVHRHHRRRERHKPNEKYLAALLKEFRTHPPQYTAKITFIGFLMQELVK